MEALKNECDLPISPQVNGITYVAHAVLKRNLSHTANSLSTSHSITHTDTLTHSINIQYSVTMTLAYAREPWGANGMQKTWSSALTEADS